ncbi:glycoside hydrolase [Corynespora cassiicola Philippines]|uniref:Glycoside hydrolase n=1 Tax=Corynespora cassiicola Philippines TaxID=1448308 RepID=A0A2T2N7N7_CORCC|nr:glycoside hydrolase [Corynespora cassiicola Philippines]
MHASIALIGVLAGLTWSWPTKRQDGDKPVYAHYMIGEIFDEHTRQDIEDAKSLGIDAFALNFNKFAYWSNDTVERLFKNADELDFGLFFSFDMAPGYFTDPAQYASYFQQYAERPSYHRFKGKPLVSTFGGEAVSNDQWSSFKQTVGDVLVVPGFYEATPSPTFFSERTSLDGVFNWNSWPFPEDGKAAVSSKDDETYMAAARAADKFFMLGVSPLQFKHMDEGNNWYRRGEDNLERRIEQALELQSDMIELQTWNDAGESHYMGNIWDEPMTNSPIKDYVDGYDHKAYYQILPAFIQAFKRGDKDGKDMVPTNDKPVQGAFWHHTLLVDAECSADPLGKPGHVDNMEDVVSGIILVAKGKNNIVAVVKSGDKELGKIDLVEGYNKFKVEGLTTGKVQVETWDGETMVGRGEGSLEVTDSGKLCNYNFQVVAIPS